MAATTDKCPWCGSAISHEKFVKIEAAMKLRLEKEVADRFAEQQQKLASERQALEAERAKLAAATKKQVELIKEQAEKQHRKEITEIREILQKDRAAALLKKEAEFAREREALQKKIVDMTRRVHKPGELADGVEINLYDELRGAFPEDNITRIAKAKSGEVLILDVRYKNKSAGKILIDATPRSSWQQSYVTKLRQGQTDVGAEHAILAASVFPAGKKELFVDSGVIVVAPARVALIVEVLRKSLINMHVTRLTEAERSSKVNRLFEFITSAPFKRKLAEAENLASEALQIDVDEKRAHDNVWKKRGAVITRIRNVLRDIDTEVGMIVEGKDEPRPSNVTVMRPGSRVNR
jgi:hypothetical protein